MRFKFTLFLLLTLQASLAQVNDDFSDGDFTNNPTWSGDDGDFDASVFDLHLNASAAGESYLSTSQSELGETTWEFLVHFDFNPSSTSLAKIYLVSNQADLTGSLQGYFVMIGDSEDEISLYKQDGADTDIEYVINGTDDVVDASTVNVRIQVIRDNTGNWTLFHDTSGGTSYMQEGSITIDNEFTNTSHFGVYCKYIDSRKTAIYFDDIAISTTPVVASFGVESLTKEGANAIRLTFNQNVDKTTAENTSNYSLDFGFGNPSTAAQDITNLDEVLLTFSQDFVNNDYTLNIDQVENDAQDEIINNQDQLFDVEQQTPFRNIVINEFMADPNPVVALPDAEFAELYNASNQAINLGDFTFDGETLSDFSLMPDSYVTLTHNSNTGLFSGDVIGLSSLSLSNSGETLLLRDNLNNLVDSITYTSAHVEGGNSFEQINPELSCSTSNNWMITTDAEGGTPGTQNSVYDNSPDVTGPNLIDFIATGANAFLLTFDEPMDESSLSSGTYIFDNGISENGISTTPFTAEVTVTPDLTSGVNYTITITSVTDCAGNDIQTNSLSYTYDTNPPELERILVKTANQIEVVFNEDLNEAVAETEGNYSSDHSGMNPTSAVRDDEDHSIVSLTFADEFVIGVENTLTIENLQDLQGNALASALTPTFTLSQQIDTVHVIGINLLDIYFKQDLNQASASNLANYSVDDGIGQPTSAFLDHDNDRLVHLAFTNNFDDNQELILTVSNVQNADLEFLTTPEISFVYDTSSPKLESLEVISSSSLAVTFTEKVDEQSSESKENYEYEDIFPIQAKLQSDQQTVILDFAEDFEREVVFELLIDEVKDLYGNEIKTRLKEEFVYDVFAPELDSIIVKSADELVIWFHEAVDQSTAESTTNYNIGGGIGQPTSASINLEFQNQVLLELPSNLPESTNISLNISSMTDQRGNTTSSAISQTFDYDIFYASVITPISQNIIEIEFNKVPSTSTITILSNYTLNGSVANAINFTDDRMATISFESNMEDQSNNNLVIENISDNSSNPISITAYTFGFDSQLSESYLVGSRTVAIAFDVSLDDGQVLTLSDFSASPSLGNCVAAVIDSDDPNLLRLTFEQALEADVVYTIYWQNLINEFGNRLPDYFTNVVNDKTPPAISEYLVLNDQAIWLKYNESLNEVSAEFLLNYEITPDIGHPLEAKYTKSDSSVLLEFSTPFSEGISYELIVDNIEDLSDNALFDYTIEFIYQAPELPDFGDLIITEIMADPTPEVGLSDVEYLEIFNTSSEAISLVGVSIVDESGTTTLVTGEIEPQSYLVLTTNSGVASFTNGTALGVTSFPSLNNAGETISLYAGDKQIFSTSYSSDWYKDSDKLDGGWSLEMIDTGNPCGEYNNWTASTDPKGGTPGLPNSISASNPDNFGPQLLTTVAVDASTLELTLNEKIHPDSFDQIDLTFEPSLTIQSTNLIEPKNSQIEVSLESQIQAGQSYQIEVSKIVDCLSNSIDSEQNTTSFRLPEEADPGDIIINEVLFNPRSGGVDFVELYNNSEKAINLKGWTLGDRLNDQKSVTIENLVFNPTEYLALTSDPSILIVEYPKGEESTMLKMENFPSLSDDQDSVILMNPAQLIIDQMEYQDDYHFNLLDDDEGVSLERVAFEAESTNPDSWKSAASTVGFATPGVENSQLQAANQSTATVAIEPRVFVPDNTGMNDFTTISYQLSQAGNFANVHIYSTQGFVIKTLAEGELLSSIGFFTWDGITDSGSLAPVGYYVVVFEIFDGQGNQSLQKETVVLGTKF